MTKQYVKNYIKSSNCDLESHYEHCNFMIFSYFNLLRHSFKLISQKLDLLSHNYDLITHNVNIAGHNLYFLHYNLNSETHLS